MPILLLRPQTIQAMQFNVNEEREKLESKMVDTERVSECGSESERERERERESEREREKRESANQARLRDCQQLSESGDNL